MIRNNSVYYYNTNRSRPVTVQCINTLISVRIIVRIIVPFFCTASRPLSISHQLILVIDIA